jgi:mono/diheme cytochrome c family protein
MAHHLLRRSLLQALALLSLLTPAIHPQYAHVRPAAFILPTYSTRQSSTDLEITNLPNKPTQYLHYADLLHLPQTTTTLTNDPDFPNLTLHISGVSLETLLQALNVPPSLDLVDALCTDRYRAHYPAEYIHQHHPILALRIDTQTTAAWAAQTHQYDPGPYFITYDHFTPAFHALSHADQPQVPDNITRLNLSTTAATYAPITPPIPHPPGSAIDIGFTIAKQNCLRCHNAGPYGGTKSGRDWRTLSTWAREQPGYFARYIANPQAIEPHAHMPPNPQYDPATLAALTAYFKSFHPEPSR